MVGASGGADETSDEPISSFGASVASVGSLKRRLLLLNTANIFAIYRDIERDLRTKRAAEILR